MENLTFFGFFGVKRCVKNISRTNVSVKKRGYDFLAKYRTNLNILLNLQLHPIIYSM